MNLSASDKALVLAELERYHPAKTAVGSKQKGKPLPSAGDLVKNSSLKPHKDQGMCTDAHFDDVAIMVTPFLD